MNRLDGTRVLVVEDDALIATALCSALVELGAEIVGPAGTVSEAMSLLASEEIEAAVLDVNLGPDLVYPAADRLIERQVPFIFATGFPVSQMPIKYWHLPTQDKPYHGHELAKRLAAMCDVSSANPFPAFFGPDPAREQRRAALT